MAKILGFQQAATRLNQLSMHWPGARTNQQDQAQPNQVKWNPQATPEDGPLCDNSIIVSHHNYTWPIKVNKTINEPVHNSFEM